ncbi:MAG: hypothetical protein WCJ30_13480, partial [Deltaproteobacteria bacterium]
MRGGFLGVIGVVLVGAWVSDCGPPPVPLTGSIHYNTGCRANPPDNLPCNSSEVSVIESQPGLGVPPAVVSCFVAPPASSGRRRLRSLAVRGFKRSTWMSG